MTVQRDFAIYFRATQALQRCIDHECASTLRKQKQLSGRALDVDDHLFVQIAAARSCINRQGSDKVIIGDFAPKEQAPLAVQCCAKVWTKRYLTPPHWMLTEKGNLGW
jgi:hypothetical protein